MITGPGSLSVLSNMMISIEQHVDWIADAVTWARDRGTSTLEPTTVGGRLDRPRRRGRPHDAVPVGEQLVR